MGPEIGICKILIGGVKFNRVAALLEKIHEDIGETRKDSTYFNTNNLSTV